MTPHPAEIYRSRLAWARAGPDAAQRHERPHLGGDACRGGGLCRCAVPSAAGIAKPAAATSDLTGAGVRMMIESGPLPPTSLQWVIGDTLRERLAARRKTDRQRRGADGAGQGVVGRDVEVTNAHDEVAARCDIPALVAKRA